MFFEAGEFVQFVRLSVQEVFGDEFDLARFVLLCAATRIYDGQSAPVGLVDGFFEILF